MLPMRVCQSGVPWAASNAAKLPLPSPVKISPPAVVSRPPDPPYSLCLHATFPALGSIAVS
jgi:hypothetical protein